MNDEELIEDEVIPTNDENTGTFTEIAGNRNRLDRR